MKMSNRTFTLIGLMLLALGTLSIQGCGAVPATPRNWEEKDWPEHKYFDVAELSRSVLTSTYGFQIIEWEHDPGKRLVTFTTLWNDRDADQAVFSGAGKRRKVWVEVEETAVDLRYDPVARDAEAPTSSGKMRIEQRDGRYVKIVTRLAIACRREKNTSTTAPGDSARGEWKDDGSDDQAVQTYMADISSRLRDIRPVEFDASEKGKAIHLRYFRDEELTPAEKEARNRENTKRIREEIERAKRDAER